MTRPLPTAAGKQRRPAFTLVEIILALAIFAGAIAVLGELMRLSLRNAETARDVTHAQFLGESILTEIASGAVPAVAVSDAPCGTEIDWRYSVELLPTDTQGLVAVRVVVYRPELTHAASRFELVRWIEDPGVQLSTGEDSAASAGATTATAGGGR